MSNAADRANVAVHIGKMMAMQLFWKSENYVDNEFSTKYALENVRKAVHTLTTQTQFNAIFYMATVEMFKHLERLDVPYAHEFTIDWWNDINTIERRKEIGND